MYLKISQFTGVLDVVNMGIKNEQPIHNTKDNPKVHQSMEDIFSMLRIWLFEVVAKYIA